MSLTSIVCNHLGNDPDQDSDREPEPPTKAIDKPSARFGKRDAPKVAPAAPEPTRGGAGAGRGGRRGGYSNEEGNLTTQLAFLACVY